MKRLPLVLIAALFLSGCGATDLTKKKAWIEGASEQRITIATPPGTKAEINITKPDGTKIEATIDDKTIPWWKAMFGWMASKPNYQISN